MEKPPPYNPYVHNCPPPVGPPPPYPVYTPVPPPVGFTAPPGSTTTVIHQPNTSYGSIPVGVHTVRATDVVIVGGCPACRVGVLSEEFTLAGLCCAFLFFPLGVLVCLMMRERRCTNCGATFT